MIYLLAINTFLQYIQMFHPDNELLPINLDALRVEFFFGAVMFLLFIFQIVNGKIVVKNKVQILFVLGLLCSIPLSHLSHLFIPDVNIEAVIKDSHHMSRGAYRIGEMNSLFERAIATAVPMFKGPILYYLFSILIVDSRKKFKLFLGVHLVCILFLGFQGILQDRYDIHLAGQPMMAWGGDRITWVGSLADANQMAVNFVIALPLFMAVMISKEGWSMWPRIIAGGGALLMLYDIKLCNSRGGYLAALVALVVFCLVKFRAFGVLFSMCGIVIFFMLTPGRMDDLSTQEVSAQGRLVAWQKGINMVDAYPLFGAGSGTYHMYSRKVAHNSFIQQMAETGYIGLYFYIGIFYWSFKEAFYLYRNKRVFIKDKLTSICVGLLPSLCAMVSVLFFLSESKATLFMWLTIPFIIGNIVKKDGSERTYMRVSDFLIILLIEIAFVILIRITITSLSL